MLLRAPAFETRNFDNITSLKSLTIYNEYFLEVIWIYKEYF